MSGPRLILLPGLDGSGVLFGPLLDHLPPECRPIVVRYPPDQLLGYDELLPRVLSALPRDRPFAIVGESFSGPLALLAAATRPANLVAVILCASFVRNPAWLRPGWLRHLVRPSVFRLYPATKAARALLMGRSASATRSLMADVLAGLRPEVVAHRVRAVIGVDVRPQLAMCPVPILCLRGIYDLIVPGHNLAEMRSIRPSLQVATIAAPHAILQAQPAAAAAAIAAFLRELPEMPHGFIRSVADPTPTRPDRSTPSSR